MDGVSQESTPTPSHTGSPGPSFARDESPALSDERSNSPLSLGESLEDRKKRKEKPDQRGNDLILRKEEQDVTVVNSNTFTASFRNVFFAFLFF